MKDGVNSQLEPDAVAAEARPNGRVARRKAAYYAAVAAGSSPRDRVSERPIETTHWSASRLDAGRCASEICGIPQLRRPARRARTASLPEQLGRSALRKPRELGVQVTEEKRQCASIRTSWRSTPIAISNTTNDMLAKQPREALVGLPDQPGRRRRVGPGHQPEPRQAGLRPAAGDPERPRRHLGRADRRRCADPGQLDAPAHARPRSSSRPTPRRRTRRPAQAAQNEIVQLRDEIDRIGNTTSFGNQNLLDGSFGAQAAQARATATVAATGVTVGDTGDRRVQLRPRLGRQRRASR